MRPRSAAAAPLPCSPPRCDRAASPAHRPRRMDGSLARIGGRRAPADLSPGVEILDFIDDASAKLAIGVPGPVAAMLLEGAGRKLEMQGGIGRSEIARAEGGIGGIEWRAHSRRRAE